MVCHNCHGEIHDELIPKKQILELQISKWNRGQTVKAACS
jgi:hypothetical protein